MCIGCITIPRAYGVESIFKDKAGNIHNYYARLQLFAYSNNMIPLTLMYFGRYAFYLFISDLTNFTAKVIWYHLI